MRVNSGYANVRLLEELFNTGDGGIEHIGDVFRAFVFIGATFSDFKDADSEIEQVFAGATLRIRSPLRDFIRDRDHLTGNGAFANDVRISANVRCTWRVFDNSAK